MKRRRFIPWIVATGLFLMVAGVVLAFTMGNVDGVWGTIDTDGATCDRWATGPASMEGPAVVTISGTPTNGVKGTTSGTSLTFSHSTGSGTNRLLLVGISWGRSADGSTARTISSVTFGGTALTLVGTSTRDVYRNAAIYRLVNPPASTTADVIVTFSDSATFAVAGAVTFAGANQTAPLGTFASANGAASPATVNVTTVAGDLVFDTMAAQDTTVTVGAGQQQRWNALASTGTYSKRGAGSTELATGTSTTMSWTLGTSSAWAIAAVPIKPATSPDYDTPTSISNTNPAIQGTNGTDWNQVRYGNYSSDTCDDNDTPTLAHFAGQSGFGFDGTNDVIDPAAPYTNVPFYLGKFCHFNNPITVSNLLQYVDLSITVAGLACPPGGTINKPSLSFSYRFTLDETNNNANPCPYGDTIPCGDQVTIGQLTTNDNFTCTYAGPSVITYTIKVLGFVPQPVGGHCDQPGDYSAANVKNTYFSDEGDDNCACLWAEVTTWTPTAVKLTAFTASSGERRQITLQWATASETDNLGFNVFRATSRNGVRSRLNDSLIPSSVAPGSPFGADYVYVDTTMRRGLANYYWLEDVDIYGNTTLHGPVIGRAR